MRLLPSRQRAVDIAAAALCTAGGLVSMGNDPLNRPLDVLRLLLGIAMLAAVFVRRRFPVWFVLLATVVGQVAPLATWLPTFGAFNVAVHRRRRVALPVAAVVGVAGAVMLLLTVPDPVARWPLACAAFVLVAAATGWGMYVRARRKLLDSLRERAGRAEAEQAQRAEEARAAERRRIAREMHDVLGHRLALISVHAGALQLRTDLPPESVTRAAKVLRDTAHAAMSDLREIVSVLHDPVSGDGPQPGFADLTRLVDESRVAANDVELTVDATDVPEQLGRTAHRIVQEGLTNALRHAPGAPVTVEVAGRAGDTLTVHIVTGRSTRVPTTPPGAGTGLIGLAERVELAGGELAAGRRPDGRHELTARIPWPR